MRIGSTLVLVLTVSAVAPRAQAQDAAKVGITMGVPQSIGIIWQSKKFALRPEVTFAGSSASSPVTSATSTSWNVGVGLSALFYLHHYEHLRTYVSPRFDYNHASSSIAGGTAPVTDTSRWSAGGTGSFGAQYEIADKFAVFGEAGFTFSHTTLPSLNTSAVGHSNGWGTRTAVGVIFYPGA